MYTTKDIWQFSSSYGMVAKAMYSNTYYASEAWLISPCVDITEGVSTILTFQHAAKFFSSAEEEMTLWVSTDYKSGLPNTATWNKLNISNYPSGSNWTFVNSGNIDLSAYAGSSVAIAFKYVSSNTVAAQWEIKNFSIQTSSIPSSLENSSLRQTEQATKVFENGIIYILLPDGRKYNLLGAELK